MIKIYSPCSFALLSDHVVQQLQGCDSIHIHLFSFNLQFHPLIVLIMNAVKSLLNPSWYKTQLNCYIQHVRKTYIRPGKPDFLFQMMVGVGIIGYCMPYFSTHSKFCVLNAVL